MGRFLISSMLFFFYFQAMGQAQLSRPLGSAEKIIVRGFRGRLNIEASADDQIHLKGQRTGGPNTSNIYLKENGPFIEVVVRGASPEADWQALQSAKQAMSQYDVHLKVPSSKPVEIFWGEGQVQLQGVAADISLQSNNCDVLAKDLSGHLKVQNLNGKTRVIQHKGPVDLQTFKGQVQLEKVAGVIHVNNHSASYRMTDIQGPLEFRNHSGAVAGQSLNGRIELSNVNGGISLEGVQGSLNGELTGGRLAAKFTHLQGVNISSDEAVIEINSPKESGALVTLRTEKGQIYAPPYLGKQVRGVWTEKRGQLRGEEQGNVKIVSKYGDIVLR